MQCGGITVKKYIERKRRETPFARNTKLVGHLDIPGGGQIVVQDGFAYIAHLGPPHGTSIVDVSDPSRPRLASTIPLDDPYTHTHKVRVVGDVMYTNYEQNNRYFYRRGEKIPAYRAEFSAQYGHQPTDDELLEFMSRDFFSEGKRHILTRDDLPELLAAQERGYKDGGFRVYDVSDRTKPKLITHHRTHGWGVHRFDVDENYLFASTEWDGYQSNIIVIYDVSDPARPQYVSHWGLPGQHLAAGEVPHWQADDWRVHHGLRSGNQLWVSALWGGMFVVDISDIRNPRQLAHYNYHPPFTEPTHTALPVPFEVAGRRIAIVGDETQIHRRGQPYGMLWVMDVGDLNDIKPLSVFTVSELDSPQMAQGRWFGCHQFQEHFSKPLAFAAWFAGGMRIVDFSDPTRPVEAGCFVPPPSGGQPLVGTNDVDVDDRGLIYLLDRYNGLDIVEFTPGEVEDDEYEGLFGCGCD